MRDWNIVVTVRDSHFRQAVALLRKFGEVEKTHFYDVLVMKVADVPGFTEQLRHRLEEHPADLKLLGHVAPCSEAFNFGSPADFAEKARETVRRFEPALAGKSFHVRMHRRGFKGQMHATQEEQLLSDCLLQAVQDLGRPCEVTFDDPDCVLAVETVDTRAGVAFWTREDLKRFPFLRID
jgi:tRNA(Ser,Leu) C12 N-acetylase TAN1